MDPETPYPVIDLLPEQKEIEDLGGTMRLGAQAVELVEGARAHEAYGEAVIHERHRHRYEVNNVYRQQLADAGLVISGTFQEAASSRSRSSATIPGSSRASSNLSLGRARPGRRRSSVSSCPPRTRGRASARRLRSAPRPGSASSTSPHSRRSALRTAVKLCKGLGSIPSSCHVLPRMRPQQPLTSPPSISFELCAIPSPPGEGNGPSQTGFAHTSSH